MARIAFDPRFEFTYGRLEPVCHHLRRIVARNPGPFTGPGTGTYVIGQGNVAVIDPGPMLPDHIDALLAGLGGETISHILVTHTHMDHSSAARLLQQHTGAPILAYHTQATASPGDLEGGVDRDFRPDFPIQDGEIIQGDGWTLEAIYTPGHCSNHLCFAWLEGSGLFCGDHVMAWATPVIIPPDGSIQSYLESLKRLLRRSESMFYPTHGTPINQPKTFLAQVHAHRLDRVAQVAVAIDAGLDTLQTLREHIYPDIPRTLHTGAEHSLRASILYLQQQGRVRQLGRNRDSRYVAAQ